MVYWRREWQTTSAIFLHKKDLNEPDNHYGYLSNHHSRRCDHSPRARHPVVQSQVGLRKHHMNKASGDDEIPAELFQILKDDVVKVLHSIFQQIWKTQQWPQDWKRSASIPIPNKGNIKECSNYHTIAFIPHTNKVMLKILQARLQQYMSQEHPDVQAEF